MLKPLEPGSIQWQIANAEDRHVRVLAGPGTGKTVGLQHRVARLLQDGVPPADILAVTFTRAAASSLRNDLLDLGIDKVQNIEARTLHSLAFGTLQRRQAMQLTGRTPRPLLEFELDPLLADLPPQFAGEPYNKREKRRAIRAFESAWAQLQHQEPGWPEAEHEREFHKQLRRWIEFHRAMLLGEVVPTLLDVLRTDPASQPRYGHVLVDEYQDLNRAEQDLVAELGRNGSHLVIGDSDQSIYSFKFAHPEGILNYNQRFHDVLSFDMTECYRCPPLVVDMANSLLTHQTRRLTQHDLLCANHQRPQDVDVVRWPSIEAEARGVARYVDAYLRAHPDVNPGRVLILSPRRHLGYLVRDELESLGRASKSYFQEQELDDISARRAFTLLRLLVDPTDRVAIRWWLGHGSTDWLYGSYRRIWNYCEKHGQSPAEVLAELSRGELTIPYSNRLLVRWDELKARLRDLDGLLGFHLVDELLPDDNEGCRLLREAALDIVAEDMHPLALFDALGEAIRGPEVPRESNDIRVMSLHKSKGLTADLVVVVGLIEGLLPHIEHGNVNFTPDQQMDEQRRLFYVAITRTTRALLLSSGSNILFETAQQMNMPNVPGGRRFESVASRFITEVTPPAPRTLTDQQLADKYGFVW